MRLCGPLNYEAIPATTRAVLESMGSRKELTQLGRFGAALHRRTACTFEVPGVGRCYIK